MSNRACPVSLMDLENKIDGSALYKGIRHERPVYFDTDYHMYVVSRYEDIMAVFRQPNLFSNALALFSSYRFEDIVTKILDSEGHGVIKRVLPMTDPPEHTRVRSLVNLAFSARRVAKIQDYIENLTNDLIDGFIDDGHTEIVSALARPLPVTVVADLLGLPRDRWQDVIRWTNSYTACAGNRLTSAEQAERAGRDLAEMQNFVVDQLDQRRKNPGDDVLTDLLNARSEGFAPLDDKEILGVSIAFIGAGHETTKVSITHVVRTLAENPEFVGQLREAPDQQAAARTFCEEILRAQPPLNALPRVTTADTEIAGVKIPAGSPVLLIMASANRDESVFGADAEEFCPARTNAGRHLTFGGGVHACLGNALARAEMKSVTCALVNRMDNLRLLNPEIPLADYAAVIMDWNYRLSKLDISFDKRPVA